MKIQKNIFNICLLLFLLFTSINTFAQNNEYYFDAVNGNDSNNGTSKATAWKTVSKFNSTNFPPGCTIAFRDSMTYRGYWKMTESGTYGNRIKVTNWSGAASHEYPQFEGSQQITGWTKQSGNIWRATTSLRPSGLWVEFADSVRWVYPTSSPSQEFEANITSSYIDLYSPSDPSSRYVSVEGENGSGTQSQSSTVFYLSGSYITLQYLHFTHSAFDGFMVDQGAVSDQILNCISSYNGISPSSGTNIGGNGGQIFGNSTRVSGCTIFENGSHGIQLIASNNMKIINTIIDSCVFHDQLHTCSLDCQTYGSSGSHLVQGVYFRYNREYISPWYPSSARYNTTTIMGTFISSQGGQNLVNNVYVIGNQFYHRQGCDIQMQNTADTVYIYNNTLANYGSGNVYDINIYSSASNEFVKNNIIYSTSSRTTGLVASGGTFDHNLYYRTNATGSGYGTKGTNYIIADPLFSNFSTMDLSLQKSSPAIDAGTYLAGYGNDIDILGTSRPQGGAYDIGAYEYNGNNTLSVGVIAKINVYLSGAYNNGSMSTDLNKKGFIPLSQPYNTPPWNYNGSEKVSSIPSSIVDWVLIELRNNLSSSSIVATRAAFLRSDGSVVDLDGSSPVYFNSVPSGSYYIVIMHRNHLAVMSASKVNLSMNSQTYDFTNSESKAYGTNAMENLGDGHFGLYSGDANGDGSVSLSDINSVWLNQFLNSKDGYQSADFNLDGSVTASDNNIYWLNNNGQNTQVPNDVSAGTVDLMAGYNLSSWTMNYCTVGTDTVYYTSNSSIKSPAYATPGITYDFHIVGVTTVNINVYDGVGGAQLLGTLSAGSVDHTFTYTCSGTPSTTGVIQLNTTTAGDFKITSMTLKVH